MCPHELLWSNPNTQSFKYAYVRLFISDDLHDTYTRIFSDENEPWHRAEVMAKTGFGNNIILHVIYANMPHDDIRFNMILRDRPVVDYHFFQIADRDA